MASIADILALCAVISAILAVVIILVAFLGANRARALAYYAMRRHAIGIATRQFFVGLGLIGLAIVFSVFAALAPSESHTAMPVPATLAPVAMTSGPTQARPTPLATLAPTTTPSPAPTTPAPVPTLTHAPIITAAIRTGDVTTAALTTTATVTVPMATVPSGSLRLRVIGTGVSATGEPLNAGTEFTRGVPSIAIFIDFSDLRAGAVLMHEWLSAGKEQNTASETLQKSGAGTHVVMWSPPGGVQVGLYEVRFGLNGVHQFVANFLVR